jgi:hypothetical protein
MMPGPCARCTRPVPCPDLGGAGLVARIMLGPDRGRVGVFRDAGYAVGEVVKNPYDERVRPFGSRGLDNR